MNYRAGVLFTLFLLSFQVILTAHASELMTPVDASTGAPAADLIYQGQPIDPNQAAELRRRGVEIWRLNPEESLIWSNTKLPIYPDTTAYPEDGARVTYDSELLNSPGLFRTSIQSDSNPEPLTLTVSLEHHAALLRSGLLRKLGYSIPAPRFYHALTVQFESIAARDHFLDEMSSATLGTRARWVRNLPKDKPEVTLQAVTLEPGRLTGFPVHWGTIDAKFIRDRRAMRSLLIPILLGELPESINEYLWESGSVFSENLVLEAYAATSFSEATFDDFKWIGFRLGQLKRADFEEIVAISGLPTDIRALVLEKLISRRNHLIRILKLTSKLPLLDYNPNISIGNVDKGKLTRIDYPGYPSHFSDPDPLSPIRRSEIFKFFKLSIISAGIGQLTESISQAMPRYMTDDVIKEHQQRVQSNTLKQQVINKYAGTSKTYTEPVGWWNGGPFGGFNISANRSVTTGTYYGSSAPLQLVDSVGISGNVGYLWGYFDPSLQYLNRDTKQNSTVIPQFSVNAALSRNYIHVRPIEDVGKGLEANWADTVVSRFMPQLAEVLEPEQKCDLQSNPIWVREFKDAEGMKFYEILFDTEQPGAAELAEKKKKELIDSNVIPNQILVRGVKGQEACKALIEHKTEGNLNSFLSQMKKGEAFIVVDSLNLSGDLGVGAPLSLLLHEPVSEQASVSANLGLGYQVLRRTHFVRTETGVQVYLQTLGSPGINYGVSLSYYTNVLSIQQRHRLGLGHTRFYSVDLSDADFETNKKTIRALKALFVHNEAELLDSAFPHYELDHDISARILNRTIISRHWDSLREEHEVAVLPPVDAAFSTDGKPMDPRKFERKLYLNRWVDRTGDNYLGFFGSIISGLAKSSKLTKNDLNLFEQPEGTNPGGTPFGRANWTEITTESEITEGAAFQPVSLMEDVWAGWSLPRKKLFRIFNEIEEKFVPLNLDHRLINRGKFGTIDELQLYEIKSTLILYPKAVLKIGEKIFERKAVAINTLYRLFGMDQCEVAITTRAQLIRGNFWTCHSSALNDILDLRANFPQDVKLKTDWFNKVITILKKNSRMDRLLEIIDSDSYVLAVKVSGFKTNDNEGTSEYLSSTLGNFNNDIGFGLFRDFGSKYGISAYEMYAKYFSTGF